MSNCGANVDDQFVLGACGNKGRPGNPSWGQYLWAHAFSTMSCSLGMDVCLILDSDILDSRRSKLVSLSEASELTLRKSLAPRHRS